MADMHQRKAEMSKHSDAFIALPGDYYTKKPDISHFLLALKILEHNCNQNVVFISQQHPTFLLWHSTNGPKLHHDSPSKLTSFSHFTSLISYYLTVSQSSKMPSSSLSSSLLFPSVNKNMQSSSYSPFFPP